MQRTGAHRLREGGIDAIDVDLGRIHDAGHQHAADGPAPDLGRLDAVEAPALRQQLAAIFDAGAVTVVIDLVGVTFIDSAGLAALVRARRDAQSAGGDLVLIRPADEAALRVFRLTQFDEVFQMVPGRGAA